MVLNTNIRIHGGRLYGKGSARIYVTVFDQDIRQKIRQDVCQRMSEALSGNMNTIIYIYIHVRRFVRIYVRGFVRIYVRRFVGNMSDVYQDLCHHEYWRNCDVHIICVIYIYMYIYIYYIYIHVYKIKCNYRTCLRRYRKKHLRCVAAVLQEVSLLGW